MKSVSIHGLRKLNFYRVAVRVPLFLVTVATVILFVSFWWWLPKPFTLTIPIRTSRAVQLKLYYTAEESKFREDWTSVRFADSRGPLKIIRLPIATSDLRGLKLHVFPGGIVDFGPVNLIPLGQAAVPIAASEISILNGSCKAEQMGSITRFYTAPDSDGFDLQLKSSQLPLRNATWLEPAAVTLLLCLLVVLVWLGTKPQKIPRLLSPRLSPRICRRIVVGFTALLVLTTVLKLNGSSSANWRFYADGRLPKDGLILGSAKDVRADEWMTQTPWMLSQAVSEPSLPTSNPNVGDAATGLLVNLPIRHWTTIFRPQFWSFFVLDFEHAFAWYWNLKWYVMVVGGFLFFRLVSRANTVATIAGTLLVFFAPYIQWWYSTGASLPETVGMAFGGLWAFHTLLRGKTPAAIWFAGLVLLYAIENFVYCCYPRFQIPLLYFSALVAIWFFFTSPPRRRYRALRWSCLAVVLALVIVCGYVWYGEVASTLRMTAQLEYPGKVFSVGGSFPWVQFLLPFLQFGMSEFHYPVGLVNASNAAGFVLLLPFILILLVTRSFARRDLLIILMLIFVVAVGYFMLVGIPPALAKYSGWSLVYSTRGILPVGIASIVCFVRALAWNRRPRIANSWLAVAATVAIGVAAWFCLSLVNQRYEGFVSTLLVIAAASYFAGAGAMLFYNRQIAVTLLAGPVVAAGALVNPISRGLPGFFRSDSYQWFRSFAGKDHLARWLVIGSDARSNYLPYLIKAAGGNVISGIRCNPDMRLFSVLDPGKQHFEVWNRFAIVSCVPSTDDKIGLDLTSGVSYTIRLPLEPDLLDRLGVRYIVTVDTPGVGDIAGFRAVGQRNGFFLRVRDTP